MCVYTNFKNNSYENIYIAQVGVLSSPEGGSKKGPYFPRLHSTPRRRAALRVRKRLSPDGIRINVTTLKDDGDISKQQVVLNITYESGQVYVNDLPINSGVTRISCQTLIVKNENLENLEEKEYFGIVSVRILVHEWPMTSGSSLQLIVIQEEVVEIDGKQVQQKDVTEIDILVKNRGILRHSNYTFPLEESMLYSISRDSDILFTLPNLSKKGNLKDHYLKQRKHLILIVITFYFRGILQLDKVDVIPVTASNLYPDGPEKTAENSEDKTCI
ncbi:PREDICTED: glycoprotein integral membrane protein 1 [Colobus angolensis palliatus]|uniref:glycoprotein integral membrane protein 1 n=1 Tax=Colobus angolensis palliatus TaxID=336983 RepID=UPI0005F495BE|nr:PREDICTED: glycoprotein integral membrane protein 1 [Colobus angolensis palliatus]